jgi:Uma2 family endonuclease
MSTITEPTVTTPGAPGLPGRRPYRLSVEKYEAMVATGAFTKHDRLELIEGMLVEKMTKGRQHSRGSENSRRAIERVLPEGWHLEIEKPIRIPMRDSEPEPDMYVARGVADDYEETNPGPEDVALVVEVSDWTLAADRAMALTYGGGGIPAYWIVNVKDRQLEVYANPVGGAYPVPTILDESASVDLMIGGQVVGRIAVADLLPRRS